MAVHSDGRKMPIAAFERRWVHRSSESSGTSAPNLRARTGETLRLQLHPFGRAACRLSRGSKGAAFCDIRYCCCKWDHRRRGSVGGDARLDLFDRYTDLAPPSAFPTDEALGFARFAQTPALAVPGFTGILMFEAASIEAAADSRTVRITLAADLDVLLRDIAAGQIPAPYSNECPDSHRNRRPSRAFCSVGPIAAKNGERRS
jgi:hypothetical protein